MSAEATGTLGRPHRWLEALWTGVVWFVAAFFLVLLNLVLVTVETELAFHIGIHVLRF